MNSLRVVVWQWGRFGSGPKFAALLADGLRASDNVKVVLSLSSKADVLRSTDPPRSDLLVDTYDGFVGFAGRMLAAPFAVLSLSRKLRALAPNLAICAMPGPMDLIMAHALRRIGVKFIVIVHDADTHPGDGLPLQMWLQRRICRLADGIAALSGHVAERLCEQGLAGFPDRPLIRVSHPPMPFPVPMDRAAGGPLRLLFFGRLLPYKGIDLLADALAQLGARPDLTVRVVGSGPELPELDRLRGHPGVSVENRWVSEDEVGPLLAWADALILPYREASQSGVAAAALAAGRSIIATEVGGLVEQLAGQPGAITCPPTPGGVASALRDLLARPRCVHRPREDPRQAWRDMGTSLVCQAEGLLRRP